MTRKERDKIALRLAMEYLTGESDDRIGAEIVDALRFALIGGEAPPWWAEVAYEIRSVHREYREENERERCDKCEGRGWLYLARTAE